MPSLRHLAPLLALALLLPAAPGAHADGALFSEDFEHGLGAWDVHGARANVTCGDETHGCSLRLEPDCCANATDVRHAVSLALPAEGKLVFAFDFRPDTLYGDTDTNVRMDFDAGFVLMHTSSGVGWNNGLLFRTDQDNGGADFAAYRDPATWHHLEMLVDGASHTAQGLWLADDGAVLGASPVLAFSPGATTVTGLDLDAVTWSDPTVTGFQYDDLSVAPSAACFAPFVGLQASPQVLVHHNASFAASVRGGCSTPASWSLDFGDGASASGDGAPPAAFTHAYETAGAFDATLNVTFADGGMARRVAEVDVTDRAVQHASGSSRAMALGVSLDDPGIVVLEKVAGRQDYLSLSWGLTAAQLDAVFYDAHGARMPSQPCSGQLLSEFCLAPPGAAYVRVSGTGVEASWSLWYDYRVDDA